MHLVTGGDLPEDVLDVDLATFDDLDTPSSSEGGGDSSSDSSSGGGPQNVQQVQQTSSQRQLRTPNKRTAGEVTFNFSPLPLAQALSGHARWCWLLVTGMAQLASRSAVLLILQGTRWCR